MLNLARKYSAGFLQASTSECYGDPEVHPQVETYWGRVNPIGPRSVYDESKRFSEAAVTAWHRYYGVDTHMVRIFNTYGPRLQANDGRVISNFMMQALHGEPLTVYGDGLQTRSFCYVSDLIAGIFASPNPPSTPRSTSATRPSSQCSSARTRSSALPAQSPQLSISRCPKTTPLAAVPTSPKPEPCSAGSPKSPSAKASRNRSPTSRPASPQNQNSGQRKCRT